MAENNLLVQHYWLALAENSRERPKELFDRLMTNWSMSIALSGLLAGFTFFVVASPPVVQTQLLWLPGLRDTGAVSLVVALGLALGSTALSTILCHFLNKCGDDDVDILKAFIVKFDWCLDMPNKLNVFALLAIALAVVCMVGSMYPSFVFGVIAVICGFAAFMAVVLDCLMRSFLINVIIPAKTAKRQHTTATVAGKGHP